MAASRMRLMISSGTGSGLSRRKALCGVDGVKQSDLRHREPHSVFKRFDLRLGMFVGRSLEQDVVAGVRIKGRIEINQVDALIAHTNWVLRKAAPGFENTISCAIISG